MSKLIPYVQTDNGWSIPDSIMSGVFLKMQEWGLVDVVFSNGTINNPASWMQFIQNKSNVMHVIGNETELEMVAWLNTFGFNYAFGHFCCFPNTWGGNSVELGKMTIGHWFNNLKDNDWQLDVIMGQIPFSNKRAIDYTKKLGMTGLGVVPGVKYKKRDKATGVYFCYITRKDFQNGNG